MKKTVSTPCSEGRATRLERCYNTTGCTLLSCEAVSAFGATGLSAAGMGDAAMLHLAGYLFAALAVCAVLFLLLPLLLAPVHRFLKRRHALARRAERIGRRLTATRIATRID